MIPTLDRQNYQILSLYYTLRPQVVVSALHVISVCLTNSLHEVSQAQHIILAVY